MRCRAHRSSHARPLSSNGVRLSARPDAATCAPPACRNGAGTPRPLREACMSVAGKLLVIDDSELVLERVKARLQRESYEVTTTSEPVGAVRHLLLCDLVIVDFHMPGMNGSEVL